MYKFDFFGTELPADGIIEVVPSARAKEVFRVSRWVVAGMFRAVCRVGHGESKQELWSRICRNCPVIRLVCRIREITPGLGQNAA